MATVYDIGDAPVVTCTFRDLAGTLTSPTTVTAKLVEPDGTQSDLSPVEESTGVYSATVPTIDQAGTHTVKFFGAGALVAAEELSFRVRSTKVT